MYYDILLWKYTTHFRVSHSSAKITSLQNQSLIKRRWNYEETIWQRQVIFIEKLLMFVQWFMWILSTSFEEMNRRQIRECATSRRVNRKRKKSKNSYLKYPNAQCWFGNDSMYGFEIYNNLHYEQMYTLHVHITADDATCLADALSGKRILDMCKLSNLKIWKHISTAWKDLILSKPNPNDFLTFSYRIRVMNQTMTTQELFYAWLKFLNEQPLPFFG